MLSSLVGHIFPDFPHHLLHSPLRWPNSEPEPESYHGATAVVQTGQIPMKRIILKIMSIMILNQDFFAVVVYSMPGVEQGAGEQTVQSNLPYSTISCRYPQKRFKRPNNATKEEENNNAADWKSTWNPTLRDNQKGELREHTQKSCLHLWAHFQVQLPSTQLTQMRSYLQHAICIIWLFLKEEKNGTYFNHILNWYSNKENCKEEQNIILLYFSSCYT